MTPRRRERLEQLLRQLLSELLLGGGIKDHRVDSNILIHEVVVARDFSAARIYVSSHREDRLEKAVEALNHAAGYIRHLLAPKLHTRFIPLLTFYVDLSVKKGSELCFKMERELGLERSDAEQSDAEQSDAEQSDAEQSDAEQ